jgi:hypothetical protein
MWKFTTKKNISCDIWDENKTKSLCLPTHAYEFEPKKEIFFFPSRHLLLILPIQSMTHAHEFKQKNINLLLLPRHAHEFEQQKTKDLIFFPMPHTCSWIGHILLLQMIIFFLDKDMLMNWSYSSSSNDHLFNRQRHAYELIIFFFFFEWSSSSKTETCSWIGAQKTKGKRKIHQNWVMNWAYYQQLASWVCCCV